MFLGLELTNQTSINSSFIFPLCFYEQLLASTSVHFIVSGEVCKFKVLS